MSDVEGLMAAFETGELLRPSSEEPGIVDLGNAIAALAGVENPAISQNARDIAELIGPSRHLVFIAADGLGVDAVNALGDDSFIAGHVAARLRTVFPSSTPVVFASLATGQWPGQHSIIGWHVYLEEIDVVSNIIRFNRRSDERDLSTLGVSPEQTYPVPSLIGRFGRDSLSLLPHEIADSVFSTYVSGGTPQQGYETLSAAIDAVLSRLSQAKDPTYTYLYTPNVDSAAHQFGREHDNTLAVIRELDGEVRRLAEQMPAETRVVMTADHGLLDADESQFHRVEPSDEMLELLERETWGDYRDLVFDVKEGDESKFESMFRERFGCCFYLVTVEEAEQLELYGPGQLSPSARRRLGSHIAISRGADVIKILYPTPPGKSQAISHHSGLTPSEMLVPLIVV